MPNEYLELIKAARGLPAQYSAMGTRQEQFKSPKDEISVTGWRVCQFAFKHNEDQREWWDNSRTLIVDVSGQLWALLESSSYSPYEHNGVVQHSTSLTRVDGEQLRKWHTNNWDYAKIKRSITAML